MTNTSAQKGKDVIYIDVDEEITAIIDKVRGSDQRIVALVLPKRAAVLQSVVNMKLLKRSADAAKKHIVLITGDAGILPLAGAVGLHVAKTLQTKPEVPDAPAAPAETADDAMEDTGDDAEPDTPLDKTRTLGELAGEETIELDNSEDESDNTGPAVAGKTKPSKGKNKRLKIPNFNKFRLLLVAGAVALVLLIVGGVMAFTVLPKASITIKTDSTAVNSSQEIILNTSPEATLDLETGTIPAQAQQTQKTLSQQVPATGQKNNGQKASGSVTLSLNDCAKDQVIIPAGTGLSASGKTFITQTSATLESVKVGNQCKNSNFPNFSTKTVAVEAQSAGASYNIAPSAFTVAGYSNVSAQSGAAMAGGTDEILKIVTQADIDGAKQKIGAQDAEAVKQELKAALVSKGVFVLDSTFSSTTPDTKLSVNAGDQADVVTVTQTVVYTMLGVQKGDLEKAIAEDIKDRIDTDKQTILDYGLEEASFNLQNQRPDGALVGVQTTVVAGPDLDKSAIKKQVAGKKAGDAQRIIKENPGVTDVTVEYSPFWVSSIPGNTSKITVTVEEPKVTPDTDDAE